MQVRVDYDVEEKFRNTRLGYPNVSGWRRRTLLCSQGSDSERPKAPHGGPRAFFSMPL